MRTLALLPLLLLSACGPSELALERSIQWTMAGQDAIDRGDDQAAREALAKAIELNRRNANAWMQLCIVEYDTRNFGAADRACSRSIAASNGQPEYHALLNRGLTRVKLGELDGAYEDFQACKRLEPDNAEAWYDESWVWAARGDLDQVILNVKRAGELDPFYAHRDVVEDDAPYAAFHSDPRWQAFVATLRSGEATPSMPISPLLDKNPVSGVPER